MSVCDCWMLVSLFLWNKAEQGLIVDCLMDVKLFDDDAFLLEGILLLNIEVKHTRIAKEGQPKNLTARHSNTHSPV